MRATTRPVASAKPRNRLLAASDAFGRARRMKSNGPTIRRGGQGGNELNGLHLTHWRIDVVRSVIRVRRGGFNP